MGKIIVISILFIMIYGLSSQLAMIGIKYRNPFYKFKLDTDPYDGLKSVSFKTIDDKFAYFWLSLLWLPLVILYYIPVAIFKILKFFINAIGWAIARIFKL